MSTVDVRRFLTPTQVRTPFQAAEERRAALDKPGVVQTAIAAIQVEHLLPAFYRQVARGQIPVDEDWQGLAVQPKEIIAELTEGLPPSFFRTIDEANSLAEARLISENGRALMQAEQLLSRAGFLGLGARMGAAIFDPITLGAGLGVGSLLVATSKSATIARLAGSAFTQQKRWNSLIKTGAIVGVTEAGIEAVLSQDNPERGPLDIMVAGLSAGLFSTALGFGPIAMAGLSEAARKTVKEIQAADGQQLVRLHGDTAAFAAEGTPAAEAFSEALSGPLRRLMNQVEQQGLSPEDADYIFKLASNDDFKAAYESFARMAPGSGDATIRSLATAYGVSREEAENILAVHRAARGEADLDFGAITVRPAAPAEEAAEELVEQAATEVPLPVNSPHFQRGLDLANDKTARAGARQEIIDEFGFDSPELEAFTKGFQQKGVDRQSAAKESFERIASNKNISADDALEEIAKLKAFVRNEFGEDLGAAPPTIKSLAAKLSLLQRRFDKDQKGQAIGNSFDRFHKDLEDELVRPLTAEELEGNFGKSIATEAGEAPPVAAAGGEGGGTKLPGFSGIADEPPPPKVTGDYSLQGRTNDASVRSVKGLPVISMAGALSLSTSSMMRRTANSMGNQSLPFRGEAFQALSASEYAVRTSSNWRFAFNTVMLDAWDQFKVGYRKRDRFRIQEQFLVDGGKAMRGAPQMYPGNKHVRAMADGVGRIFADIGQAARRHDLPGFQKVSRQPDYLPRFHIAGKYRKALARYDDGEVQRLVKTAIERGYEDIDEEVADKWAGAIIKITLNQDAYTDLQRAQIFAGDRLDLLQTALTDEGIDKASIDRIVDLIRGTSKGQDPKITTARAQRRARMDESVSLPLKLRDGTGTEEFALADLFENNIHELMELYTRQVAGAIAMNEVFRELGQVFGQQIDNFGQLRTLLKNDMVKQEIKGLDITRDLDKLETLFKSITGRRLAPDSNSATFMRNTRQVMQLRIVGQLGIAQIPELGIALGSVGMRVMMQQMPALRDITKMIRTGKTTNPMLNDLQTFVALGQGRRNDMIVSNFDTAEMINEAGGGRIERTLRRMNRLAGDFALLPQIHFFEQMAIGTMAMQRMANIAMGGRPLSKSRMKELGLSENTAKKIFDQIKQHSTFERPEGGGRLIDLDLSAWDDVVAGSDMITTLQRWSSINIQQIDIGNLSRWMTTDIGKLIFQYRPFAAVAYEKQFQRRMLNLADPTSTFETTMEMTYAMLFAGIAYMLQQKALSVGRPDKEEFLERRLTTDAIGAAAFQRAGFTSFFPDAAETLHHLFGGTGSLFDFRNSGLATTRISTVEGLLSNPSFDFGNKAFSSLRSAFQATLGDENFTQADVRRFGALLPFGRHMGVLHLIGAISQGFPEE